MSQFETALFQTVIMQSWNAVVITDADLSVGGRVLLANPAFCQMTGYSLDELRGHSLKCLQGPETDPLVIAELRKCLHEGRYFEGTAVNYRKDGSTYVVRWNISPIKNDAGVITHYVSVQQDLSDLIHSQQENDLLARALNATHAPVMITQADEEILFVNTAFAELTGYSVEELIGQTPALLQSGQHDEVFYQTLHRSLLRGESFRATFVNRRKDATLYHAEQSISPIFDAQQRISHFISVSKDISERVKKEEVLAQLAHQDKLTGLYNRHYGDQLLQEKVLNRPYSTAPVSILLCDLDHFKQINDRFGHPVGDRVLQTIAQILKKTLRQQDTVIRWGGEEFLILLDACSRDAAIELAERIRLNVANFEDPEAGQLTLSIALAVLNPNESLESFIARADKSLYLAKQAGRNRLMLA